MLVASGNTRCTHCDDGVMKKLPGFVVIAVIAITALSLLPSACSALAAKPWQGTQLDQWGWYACDDFTKQLGKSGGAAMAYALMPAQRAQFVSGMAQAVDAARTPAIKDAGVVLSRTVTGPQGAWKMGLDTFTARCLDRGYRAS
jgi:hypothetical protein